MLRYKCIFTLLHSGDIFVDELKHSSCNRYMVLCMIFVGVNLFLHNKNLDVFGECDVDNVGNKREVMREGVEKVHSNDLHILLYLSYIDKCIKRV